MNKSAISNQWPLTLRIGSSSRLATSFERVTFDQNVPKCRFGDFEFLAANLPNWRFRRNKNVIRTIGQNVKAEGFGNSYILNFRSDDVTILRNVKNGHFGRKM